MTRFQIWYTALPVALKRLLSINVAAWVLWVVLLSYTAGEFVRSHFAFHTEWREFLFEPWQLVTYAFLHLSTPVVSLDALLHVGFNMLWLYWIGRDFEEVYGASQILGVYLLSAIGGALLSALAHAFLPAAVTGGTMAIIHGASASVLGIVAAAATHNPQRRIRLLLFGSVRLVHLVIAFLVLDVLFVTRSSTAVFAHIGGALSGFLIVRIERRGIDLTGWTRIFVGRRQRRRGRLGDWLGRVEQRFAQTGSFDGDTRPVSPPVVDEAELLQRQVDRVLDKISEHGMESLTPEDRELLERASQ